MALIIKTNFALTRSLMIIQLLFYDDCATLPAAILNG